MRLYAAFDLHSQGSVGVRSLILLVACGFRLVYCNLSFRGQISAMHLGVPSPSM
jgi:hypothetical protein